MTFFRIFYRGVHLIDGTSLLRKVDVRMRTFIFFGLVLLFGLIQPLRGAARISYLSKEVKIVPPQNAPHRAFLHESIGNGAAIQTGAAAQTELRFENGTLVRLAANTLVRLHDGEHKMELLRGAILVRAPANFGASQITAANVVTAVQGTTSVLEFYPQAYTKLIVLDGTARMFMPSVIGESVLIEAGQLLMFQAKAGQKSLPNPVDIDLKRMMATSLLIRGFPPLGNETAIAQGMRNQTQQKSDGALAETNLVIFGRGTLVSLVPPPPEKQKGTAKPSPSPGSTR